MPAFTFIADSATDQLTIVGHGFNTGDGPAATRNFGGALPGGLATVTDYWFIRVDADHVKLATSSSNAHAGIAINITSNGTGTQLLLLGLPYRRPRTYAPQSQVKSQDLNAIFDAFVAIYNLFTGQPQTTWDPLALPVAALDLFETAAPNVERIRIQAAAALSANQTWTLPAALPASGRAMLRIDASGNVSCDQAAETNVSAAAGQLTSIGQAAGRATFEGDKWFLGTSGAGQGPTFNIPTSPGATLSAVKAYGARGNATGGITATYFVRNKTTGNVVANGSATQNTGLTDFTLTITSGLPLVIQPNHVLDVTIENSGGAGSGNIVRGCSAVF